MNVGPVQKIQIVIGIDMRAGLQADDRPESFGMLQRQMQRDAPSDRAAHHDRLVEFQRGHDVEDHGGVMRRGQLVLLVVPAGRWRRFAMPGHVEGDDAMVFGNAGMIHQGAILPSIRSRGMQAKQRRALSGFLDIDPMRAAEQVEMHVTPDDGLECRAHAVAPEGRSFSRLSLK